MANITIYHNPKCSKSRAALAYLQAQGEAPEVVYYIDTPLTQKKLKGLLSKLGINARALLRKNESDYKALGLADEALSEAKLIAAMVAHPKLMQRPIVEIGEKAVVARPTELIDDILSI